MHLQTRNNAAVARCRRRKVAQDLEATLIDDSDELAAAADAPEDDQDNDQAGSAGGDLPVQ